MTKIYLALITLFMTNLFATSNINIAVAANVSYAIDELVKEFEKRNPDTKVQVTIGGSGKLTAQIIHGASYQIFMSADMNYPKKLQKLGLTLTKPAIYAQGALAIFSKKERDFSKGLNLLLDKKIEKIAIANPKTAPYGKATVEALKNSGLYEKLKDKFIYGESISQTLSYIFTAADIGIIAKSALYSKEMTSYKEYKNYQTIDTKLYTPIKQGVVMLKSAKESNKARVFYEFILSHRAKEIFKSYGYL